LNRVELSNLYVPGRSNLHLPSQSVFGELGLTGTVGEQVGAMPVHAMFAGVLAVSLNMTSPPVAIVTMLAGAGFAPEPGTVQQGQLASTQFSLTSSFASDAPAASAGSTATPTPSSTATAKSESVRGLIVTHLSRAGCLHGNRRRRATAPSRP
jgi:hypothetical protein